MKNYTANKSLNLTLNSTYPPTKNLQTSAYDPFSTLTYD